MTQQTDNEQPKSPRMERHVQTILVSIITAAILWSAVKLTSYQELFGRLDERIIALSNKLDDVVKMRNDVESLKVRVSILESNKKEHR
ncbi:hypothetical protein [Hydrogenovibrio marinus]|uniref:Uncharacterized protein n=1 Tax=Hydrogenovibrio marinus TaxID=28885 RepID=A0A066ZRE8_HYDMR|nr:hypothetical protein [Hydrogenovibrio marinus]KDN94839.1 hypothetical protein EI16_00550 [Hydrogenovibrio marinus]BBN59298.1 hypothetical protein HVMH_0892 [Hydrogenovibrio marinus]